MQIHYMKDFASVVKVRQSDPEKLGQDWHPHNPMAPVLLKGLGGPPTPASVMVPSTESQTCQRQGSRTVTGVLLLRVGFWLRIPKQKRFWKTVVTSDE